MFLLLIIFVILITSILVFGVLTQLKNTRGKFGELLVRFILACLPREYRVFYDVRFNVERSRCQIDHLVVSPYGIFVIEAKSYLGLTVGHTSWSMWRRYVLGKRYITRSPLVQNERYIKMLKTKYPEIESLFAEAVKSVIVFGFGSIIKMKDSSRNVMTIFSIYKYIRSFKQQRLNEIQYKSICNKFETKGIY